MESWTQGNFQSDRAETSALQTSYALGQVQLLENLLKLSFEDLDSGEE